MTLKPFSDRVVVKQAEAEETTRGGIILADVSKEKPCIGTIISVGPGEYLSSGDFIEMNLKPGQTVMYSRYGGVDVTLPDGDKVTVLRLADLIGLMES